MNTLTMEKPVVDTAVGAEVKRLLDTDFAWEATGEAETVLDELLEVLNTAPALYESVSNHVGNFAMEVASPLVALTLEVSEKRPDDLPHDPNRIILYEENGEIENDFMTRTVRYTIGGTKSSMAATSDLDAYMNAFRKKRLVLYLGSFRADDMTTLDTDFNGLIDTMAAMGIPDDIIEEMVALLISGDAPEALVEAAEAIIALGKMEGATPEMIAPVLQKLETSLQDALPQAKSEKVAIMVARITEGLQPLTKAAPATIAPKIQAFQRGEAPAQSERLAGLKVVTNVVQTTAMILKDPALPAADRVKLSTTLAGLRANIFNPQSPVFNQTFVKLATQIVPMAERFPPASPLGAKVQDAVQAVAKAAITLLPPSVRQSLSLPAAMGEKPSSIANTKLSAETIKAVMATITRPAVSVNGRTVAAIPLTSPRTMLRQISTGATTPQKTARFAAKANNDNPKRPIVSALRSAMGEMLVRAPRMAAPTASVTRPAAVSSSATPATSRVTEPVTGAQRTATRVGNTAPAVVAAAAPAVAAMPTVPSGAQPVISTLTQQPSQPGPSAAPSADPIVVPDKPAAKTREVAPEGPETPTIITTRDIVAPSTHTELSDIPTTNPVSDTIGPVIMALANGNDDSASPSSTSDVLEGPTKTDQRNEAIQPQTDSKNEASEPNKSQRSCSDQFCNCAGNASSKAVNANAGIAVNPADTPPPELSDYKEKVVYDSRGNPSIVSPQEQLEDAIKTRDIMIAEYNREQQNPSQGGQTTPNLKDLLKGYDLTTISKEVTKTEIEKFTEAATKDKFNGACGPNCNHDNHNHMPGQNPDTGIALQGKTNAPRYNKS